MASQKIRIVELQRQVRVARLALSKIAMGTRAPDIIASEAIDNMWPDDPKQPLQKIVGHEGCR